MFAGKDDSSCLSEKNQVLISKLIMGYSHLQKKNQTLFQDMTTLLSIFENELVSQHDFGDK